MRPSILIASLGWFACGGTPPPGPTNKPTRPRATAAAPDPVSAPDPVPADPVPAVDPVATDAPPKPIDDKVAAKASTAFLDALTRSRGAIQSCHAAASKNDPSLGKITLTVTAQFSASGRSSKVLLTPFITQDFEACVQAVATTWKLELPAAMTFKANVTLSP